MDDEAARTRHLGSLRDRPQRRPPARRTPTAPAHPPVSIDAPAIEPSAPPPSGPHTPAAPTATDPVAVGVDMPRSSTAATNAAVLLPAPSVWRMDLEELDLGPDTPKVNFNTRLRQPLLERLNHLRDELRRRGVPCSNVELCELALACLPADATDELEERLARFRRAGLRSM